MNLREVRDWIFHLHHTLPLKNLRSLIKLLLFLAVLLSLYLNYTFINTRNETKFFRNETLQEAEPSILSLLESNQKRIEISNSSTSILWYTKLSENYEAGHGFVYEAFNFMIPLAGMLEFGWYAGSSLADVRTNKFFAGLSDTDQAILRDLFVNGAKIDKAFSVDSKVISIVLGRPGLYKDIFENTRLKYSAYKVGRAMFETNWIPNKWEYFINEYLDELWVPSNFARDVFRSAGVFIPIYVIGEGFDPEQFRKTLDPKEKLAYRKIFYPNCFDTDVIFLSVGKMERRKGVEILEDAFKNTFGEDKNGGKACLYIRAELNAQQKAAIKMFNDRGLRIYGLNELSNEDLILAYQSADVFALPTHGEGWGRPIMEAMAAGLPAIVPIWSGVAEFVKENYSIPLHIDKLEPAFAGEPWYIGGIRYKDLHQWAAINMRELSDLLRWCVDNPTQLKRIGEQARKVMFTHYTRENIAQDAKSRIIEIKKDITKRGWDHYLLSNKQKLSVRHSEMVQNKELRKIEQVQAN